MGEYFFGLGPNHLPEEADEIAQRHDARLVNYTEPNGEKRHWFACQNLGEPYDSRRASLVLDELEKLSLDK